MLTPNVPYVCGIVLVATVPLMAGDKRTDESAARPLRLGNARYANVGRVFAVAYSADGRLLAGGAWDGSIRIWETATAKEVQRLHEHKGPVRKVVFSPDGKWLASAGKAPGVCLWDLQAGRLARVLGSAKDAGADVDFSPDGKQIAAVAGGRLLVWDAAGNEQWRQGGDRVYVRVAFRTADSLASVYLKPVAKLGKQIAVDFNSRVHVSDWRLPAGKESAMRDLGPHTSASMPDLGPDGLVVHHVLTRLGEREKVTYFRTGRSDATHTIEVMRLNVSVLCFSRDGRMLALSGDAWGGVSQPKFIRVFEVATGQERCRFECPDSGHLSLAFSPDGQSLASGSLDVTVLLWDLTGGAVTKQQSATQTDIDRLWHDLQGSDAAVAYRAHWQLVAAAKQAVPFLSRKVQPVPVPPDPKRIAALVRDLGAEQFDTRTSAYAALSKLEDLAEPALRAGLAAAPSLEAQRRIEELLRRIDQFSPDRLVQLRAIEVLEHMNTPAAVALMRELATGCPAASVTRAAEAALRRQQRVP